MRLALMSARVVVVVLSLVATPAPAQMQTRDVIYMKAGGAAFTMDVLKPARSNKAAVVFVVSGGWISDHAMLTSVEPDLEKVFVDRGFTVFEVVHGAQPRYKVGEIVDQVRTAARYVRRHSNDFGIDADRIGVSGISSGGHLALMIAASPDALVNAVAAISPPTDLVDWGKPGLVFTDEPGFAMFLPALGVDANAPKSDVGAVATLQSPITDVNATFPPTLLVHGDSDKVVPLQQAQAMDRALAGAGVEHKLVIIRGGGHDNTTFEPGLTKALEWFEATLLK